MRMGESSKHHQACTQTTKPCPFQGTSSRKRRMKVIMKDSKKDERFSRCFFELYYPDDLLVISCHTTLVRHDNSFVSVNTVHVSNRMHGFLCLPGHSHPIACHTVAQEPVEKFLSGILGIPPCVSVFIVVTFIVASRRRGVFVNQSVCLPVFFCQIIPLWCSK